MILLPPIVIQEINAWFVKIMSTIQLQVIKHWLLFECKLCKERDIVKTYEGESCRNGYLRGLEHQRDVEKKNEKSAIYKHIVKDHANEKEKVEFKMKIVGRFKTAINRQINEGLRIQRKNPKALLNSKAEFHGPAVKRKILT